MSNNKIKLVVEIDEYYRDAIIRHRDGTYGAQLPYYIISSAFKAIANGTPYNPSGDLISREALKDITYINKGNFNTVEGIRQWIDNAPTVYLPNEQIAWEQGYEAGLAQGKQERKGEWIYHEKLNNYFCKDCGLLEPFTKEEIEEGIKLPNFCQQCGADMRKGGEE